MKFKKKKPDLSHSMLSLRGAILHVLHPVVAVPLPEVEMALFAIRRPRPFWPTNEVLLELRELEKEGKIEAVPVKLERKWSVRFKLANEEKKK